MISTTNNENNKQIKASYIGPFSVLPLCISYCMAPSSFIQLNKCHLKSVEGWEKVETDAVRRKIWSKERVDTGYIISS